MRKLILIALAATSLTPQFASAQDARDIRHDQREMRRDRNEMQRDMRQGDARDMRQDERNMRADRRDLHEDWREYRRTHRDAFRGPAYAGPRGYRYRPVAVGYRFAPEYYASRYWIANPYAYRLAPPRAHERWVRYGNDVVLVNMLTGRVVQVYAGFFW